MAKVVMATIASLTSESTAISQINQNFAQIAAELEKALSRDNLNYDGTTVAANTMLANMDMNSYRILNLPAPASYNEPARHGELQIYVDNATAQAVIATTQATTATTEAGIATTQATTATTQATNATNTYNTFRTYWLGNYAAAPTLDLLGNPLISGALYYDTVLAAVRVYNLGVWFTWPSAISNLTSLSDVQVGVLANNDVLRYNSGLGKWTNQQITGTRDILYVLDGGGSAIAANTKGYLAVDYGGTIQQVTMLADQSGSAVVDIWKCTYAQFDAGSTHPVAADKITAAAPPTITTATKSQDSTLTGWTTTITAGDILAFNVTSCSTITRLSVLLKVSVPL